jgi:hypothetical protein
VLSGTVTQQSYASKFIAADNANIQYFGRWDFTIPSSPSHSWPGVYIYTEFNGTSIGVKLNDNFCYYNVIIDDSVLTPPFHGTVAGSTAYTLATGLANTHHTITILKRDESTWAQFSFQGFYVDDGSELLPPKSRPLHRIEYIGDSFTSASGNEWIDNTPSPSGLYTNIYEGFAPISARHYGAQFHASSQSGIGLVLDYQGVYSNNMPDKFDRTLLYASVPKWNFADWVPNVVVICLGLNDYSGFGGYVNNSITPAQKELFKSTYHTFIGRIRDLYPGVKMLVLSPHPDIIKATELEIVTEENNAGYRDVFYTFFPYYDGGYVNGGHPTVATHHKIADCIIAEMDQMNPWMPYVRTTPPRIVTLPATPFIVYDTTYTLTVSTDTYATIRLSSTDEAYDKMDTVFTSTGYRTHSITLSCKHNRQYTYYLRAVDGNGNKMDSSAVVRFSVDTTKFVATWKSPVYDDSKWKSGIAPLGTSASSGNATVFSPIKTVYLRKQVSIADLSSITEVDLLVKEKDGAIVYVNGNEVGRLNMASGTDIGYDTYAMGSVFLRPTIAMNAANGMLSFFKNGLNTIAVEVHAANMSSPIQFDARLYDNNTEYYALGTDWKYDDLGSMPAAQLRDRITTSVAVASAPIPGKFALCQNYPNPFNPATTIQYSVPHTARVQLTLYDMLGREMATLVDAQQEAGTHAFTFDASRLSSGIYFLRMQTGEFVSMIKMAYLK